MAEQKTGGYYGDRIRQAEWRKLETLTIITANGYASRLERLIEKRDPDAEELSFRSILTVEQTGRMMYPGPSYQARRDEGLHAAGVHGHARPGPGDGWPRRRQAV